MNMGNAYNNQIDMLEMNNGICNIENNEMFKTLTRAHHAKIIFETNVPEPVHNYCQASELLAFHHLISQLTEGMDILHSFLSDIGAQSTFQEVAVYLTMVENVLNLNPSSYKISYSTESECIYIAAVLDDIKLMFDLFYEDGKFESMVDISTPAKNYSVEGSIEECLVKMQNIIHGKPEETISDTNIAVTNLQEAAGW